MFLKNDFWDQSENKKRHDGLWQIKTMLPVKPAGVAL